MDYELNRIIDRVNEKNGRAVISRSMREKIRVAVHRLTYAFFNHVKIQYVKEGFRDSGVFPPSLRQILNQLFGNQYQDFQEYITLKEKSQVAVEPFRDQSVLTEEQMDIWDIRKPQRIKVFPEIRGRCITIEHVSSILRVAMFLSRRGVIAEQLQLNTTYSRTTQERMRARKAELAAEKVKAAAEKAASAARRAFIQSQKRDEKFAAMDDAEKDKFLRKEGAYQRRNECVLQARDHVRLVEVAINSSNTDVDGTQTDELSTNLLPTYEMRTDELRTDELYTDVQH